MSMQGGVMKMRPLAAIDIPAGQHLHDGSARPFRRELHRPGQTRGSDSIDFIVAHHPVDRERGEPACYEDSDDEVA